MMFRQKSIEIIDQSEQEKAVNFMDYLHMKSDGTLQVKKCKLKS